MLTGAECRAITRQVTRGRWLLLGVALVPLDFVLARQASNGADRGSPPLVAGTTAPFLIVAVRLSIACPACGLLTI